VTDGPDARRNRLAALLFDALELPPEEREAFVQLVAVDSPELAAELRAMIDAAAEIARRERAANRFKLEPGDVFGDCLIKKEAGAGAMAVVYLASDLKNHDRPVAVKTPLPKRLEEIHRQRFGNEGAALAHLVHPNIARLYFSGVEHLPGGDRPYFVMEHVDGKTLGEFVKDRHPSTLQLLMLLEKISRAVHYGHGMGVFHRDLKPSNILVTAAGEPKIIDYGVAFIAGNSIGGRQTILRENVGTLNYMAPEAARGGEYVPDARSEVYALGVIAFEMFAGRLPGVVLASGEVASLEGSPELEKRRGIAGCEREPHRSANRAVGKDLGCVIAKALRLEKGDRYEDARQLADEFRRILTFRPIEARLPARLYEARMFLRRHRAATVLAVAVLLAIAAAAVNSRLEETRVRAALSKTTVALAGRSAALEQESAARKLADERLAEIVRQKAAAHAGAALLAEQHGDWAVAAREYQAAEVGSVPEQRTGRVALIVGELRALGRLDDRRADANALITRVRDTMPDVNQSPQFQVVKGFFYWASNPDESVAAVRTALEHRDELPAADRAFAEALITDDIQAVTPRLRETVDNDPFNRDALALLALSELTQGEARKCELDAVILQRQYPDDGVGAVLAAIAAAFEGRRSAAIAYLDSGLNLPDQVKATLKETVDFVAHIHSTDDLRAISFPDGLTALKGILASTAVTSKSHLLPIPLTFTRVTKPVSLVSLSGLIPNPDSAMEALSALPNGNGEYYKGLMAMKRKDYGEADRCFRKALVSPCLIDCQRPAALALMFANAADNFVRQVPPAKGGAVIEADFDQIISFGGVYPEKFNEETGAVQIAMVYHLYPQVRKLAVAWLARAPDDPRAMYFLACADSHLGNTETASALYKQAITGGLAGDMKADAQAQIRQTNAPNQ